jgi:nitrogen-specific signal transduction histidine kinase
MATPPSNAAPSTEEVTVPFERVAGLVRHLTHDIRNGLNTLDLQASFLQELVNDPEASPEVKRIRSMISTTAKTLQNFSSTFWLGEMHPVTYSAEMLVEDFRARLVSVLPEQAKEITWTVELGKEAIAVDIELIFRAFSEFFKNAIHFRENEGAISVRVFAEKERFVLELRETKTEVSSQPESWGTEPLVSTRRGGFGMGLFHARRILTAHEGLAEIGFDSTAKLLTTRLSLPLAAG